jgi:hypothetical protein
MMLAEDPQLAIESIWSFAKGLIVAGGVAWIWWWKMGRPAWAKQREIEATSDRERRAADMLVGNEHYRRVIDDLTEEATKQRAALTALQDTTLAKILEYNEKHVECEKRNAALEERVRTLEQRDKGAP